MPSFDTETDLGSELSATLGGDGWVVTLVFHADEDGPVGDRLPFGSGDRAILGRGCELFSARAFDDAKVSRRHVELAEQDGKLIATDLGSRNGTLRNGLPITRTELAEGDVLTLGGVLLLVHRGPVLMPRVSHPELVGLGAAHVRLIHRIALAAPQATTVLVRGETGVGKELVARAIHRESGRKGRFIAVNCGALSDGVLLSELFGHTRGAFTGAEGREGLVAAAEGGTLFLDEIGDASPALQAALLRLLEQREYREVGSTEARRASARFVLATHVALEEAVTQRRFRADLLGRVARFAIDVSPLRERREDIVPLARAFATRALGRPAALARSLAQALLAYGFPGNVRELGAMIDELALAQRDAKTLTLDDALAARLDAPPPSLAPQSLRAPPTGPTTMTVIPKPRPSRSVVRERPPLEALILRFRELGSNAKALADELGVGRTTLYRWFHEAGLDLRELREPEGGEPR
jgi:propionate catabolism operon transcriptional regulator